MSTHAIVSVRADFDCRAFLLKGAAASLLLMQLAGCQDVALAIHHALKGTDTDTEGEREFNRLCRTKSGIKIHRSVTGVDGIFFAKTHDEFDFNAAKNRDFEDPYGVESSASYLHVLGYLGHFNFIEIPGLKINVLSAGKTVKLELRYSGEMSTKKITFYPPEKFDGLPISSPYKDDKTYPEWRVYDTILDKPTARYEFTWSDISTPKQREHWIAGSRAIIRDRETGELIAERVGFVFSGKYKSPNNYWRSSAQLSCPELALNNNGLGGVSNMFFIKKAFSARLRDDIPEEFIYIIPSSVPGSEKRVRAEFWSVKRNDIKEYTPSYRELD